MVTNIPTEKAHKTRERERAEPSSRHETSSSVRDREAESEEGNKSFVFVFKFHTRFILLVLQPNSTPETTYPVRSPKRCHEPVNYGK